MRPLAVIFALALVAPARAARTAAVALPPIACAALAPQPSGVCQPYDRSHCRFADGTLMHDDPRDPNAPYLFSPVARKPDLYCRYDAESRPAGVETVLPPAEQKRRWDATKHRRPRSFR